MDDGQRYRDQSSQPVRALLGRRRRPRAASAAAQVKTACAPRPAVGAPPVLHASTARPSVCNAIRQQRISMTVPRPHDRPISIQAGAGEAREPSRCGYRGSPSLGCFAVIVCYVAPIGSRHW